MNKTTNRLKIKHRRKGTSPAGAPRWMVTFSDLVTLILVFFILLFSMSQVDNMKFQALAESLRGTNLLNENTSILPETGRKKQEETLDGLLQEVNHYLSKKGLTDVIVANRTERGVVLVLQEQALFASGQAEIVNESNDFLDKVGELLAEIPNLVKVEGHTDNRPITTTQFPSNWELSTARASAVIRYLSQQHQLDPARFIAVGYGDTRPIVSNTSPENWQKNRRVEIVISDPSYNGNELEN